MKLKRVQANPGGLPTPAAPSLPPSADPLFLGQCTPIGSSIKPPSFRQSPMTSCFARTPDARADDTDPGPAPGTTSWRRPLGFVRWAARRTSSYNPAVPFQDQRKHGFRGRPRSGIELYVLVRANRSALGAGWRDFWGRLHGISWAAPVSSGRRLSPSPRVSAGTHRGSPAGASHGPRTRCQQTRRDAQRARCRFAKRCRHARFLRGPAPS